MIGRYLVQLIYRPTAAERHTQVLLVSHDLTLLDLDLVRREKYG